MSRKVILGRVRDKSAVPARVSDQRPYIEVKDAIVARSGIYNYTYDEIIARGHTPKVKKAFYKEFRPASVIVRAKDMFDLVPVPNKEHTSEYITPENFHDLVSGMIGGPIEVVALENSQEIALKGRLAFFTKDAYEYYMAGNKETSADYESVTELVDNPEEVGYDLLMTEIRFVNNVAITAHGRGGSKVRVQDAKPKTNIIDKVTGRTSMGIISSFLGIGKSDKAFSAQVKDAITRVKDSTDETVIEGELSRIMDSVNVFTDSADKQVLIGAVRDSFSHPKEVLDGWKETAPLIDGLHKRCTDAEAKLLADVQDSKPKGDDDDKKKKEDDDDDEAAKKKAAESKDSFEKVVAEIKDSAARNTDEKIAAFEKKIPDLITAGIKAALNPDAGKSERHQDSAPEGDGDVSYLFE